MVKLSAGLVIFLIILSIPLVAIAAEHGIIPTLIGVFFVTLGAAAVLFSINLIFSGLEDLEKKKKK